MKIVSDKLLASLNQEKRKKIILIIIVNILSFFSISLSILFLNRFSPISSMIITILYSIFDFVISFIYSKLISYNKKIINTYTVANNNSINACAKFIKKSEFTITYMGLSFFEYYFIIDDIERSLYVLDSTKLILKEENTYKISYFRNILVGVNYD